MNTGDEENDINLDKEVHLVFPYSGGPMFGTETIGKHKETPFVTETKINVNQICKGMNITDDLRFRESDFYLLTLCW